MTTLRKDLPPLPKRMRGRPVDPRGFPVPWFVANIDGEWDFRVIRPGGIAIAVKQRVCWLCGHPLGRHMVFVIGPMCAINRVTSEPPSHRECADFAVHACPFMLRPKMRRNTHDLPDQYNEPAGIHIDRNPGVMCAWSTHSYKTFRVNAHDESRPGVLLDIGDPNWVSWWTQGRPATRVEVMAAIETGYPQLMAMAEKEGPEAVADLKAKTEQALSLLPMP